MDTYLIILVVLIALSAFFSSAETAIFSLGDIKVRNLVKKGKHGAKTLKKLKEDPHKLLITVLVGNNLVNVGASALATKIVTDAIGPTAVGVGLGISTGIMTFLLLVFGEITPKAFAHKNPERLSLFFAEPLYALTKVLSPLVWLLELITGAIIKAIGGQSDRGPITVEEIRTTITVGAEEGVIKKDEEELIRNVFDLSATQVSKVMIPRMNMFALEAKTKIKKVLEIIPEKRYTRVPVYRERLDNIVGILYVKDIIKYAGKDDDLAIESILRPPYFVPETKKLNALLKEFRKNRIHVAIVVDESGGVEGLVTLEDVLEEIVGEIYDETDGSETLIKPAEDKSFEIAGKTDIEEVNKKLGLSLHDDSYNTIAGYIIHRLGRIPKKGENIKIDNLDITIIDGNDVKIKRLKIKLV